jgi:two-component SAPR family response regulator
MFLNVSCKTCDEIFSNLEEVKEYREIVHQELLSYNCKLCRENFESRELLSQHRHSERHQMLSENVDKQFMLQLGNICEECQILKTEDTYKFCENDEHFEMFQNIWSNRQSIFT